MSDPTSPKLTDDPWQKTRFQADGVGDAWVGTRGHCRLLAHYDRLLTPDEPRLLEIGFVRGQLLTEWPALGFTGVDCFRFQVDQVNSHLPQSDFQVKAGEQLTLEAGLDVVIISDALDEAMDVGQLHEPVQAVYSPETRLIFNYHSNLWGSLFTAAHRLGLRRKALQSDLWVTADAKSLPDLSAWDVAQLHHFLVAADRGRLGSIIDHYPAPLLPFFCLIDFIVARPRWRAAANPARAWSVSEIIPARTEPENIAGAVARTPTMSEDSNLIFERGYSRDDTWTRIQKVAANHPLPKSEALRQTGCGKGADVRAEIAATTGDVRGMLDADLTMAPAELPKFYHVNASGRDEIANSVRLVYPVGERAMQFLNLCANKVFGFIFTRLLGQPVKDTLCGTKVPSRAHRENIAANRSYFGDSDPFRDFDSLFGGAKLSLKVADIPVRYRESSDGETYIQRRRRGWLLLRTVLFAARTSKFA
jgi:hypothetical protein